MAKVGAVETYKGWQISRDMVGYVTARNPDSAAYAMFNSVKAAKEWVTEWEEQREYEEAVRGGHLEIAN